MKIKFEWDDRQLRRDVEKKLNEVGAELQQALDEVRASHGGKPVAEVKKALRSALASRDTDLPEEHFEAYADAISEGRRVVIEVQKPDWNA